MRGRDGRRFGLGPLARVAAGADHRKRRDPQPRRAHRDERDRLRSLLALDGTVLQLANQSIVIQFPGRNLPRLGPQRDGHGFECEGVGRQCPALPDDPKRLGGILIVQHEAIVPRGGRVDFPLRPVVGAAVTRPFLADLERKGQRTVVNRDGVVIFRPGPHGDAHRQPNRDDVAILPGAIQHGVGRRTRLQGDGFAVELRRRFLAPARDAQVEGEADRLSGGDP